MSPPTTEASGRPNLHPCVNRSMVALVVSAGAALADSPCGSRVCVCPRIDPLHLLAGCRRRRLNQGLVVSLGFFSLLDRACFCVIFSAYGCMLCIVCYLFVISTSVIDCLGRFVPEMTYYVSSGTLNLAQLNCTRRHCKHNCYCESAFAPVWRCVT